MELYRVPAGRLATIFYNSPQRFFKRDQSDSEKGKHDDSVPPTPQHNGLTQTVSDVVRHGRTLGWRNVSLELKLKEGTRSLLDNIDGNRAQFEMSIDPKAYNMKVWFNLVN